MEAVHCVRERSKARRSGHGSYGEAEGLERASAREDEIVVKTRREIDTYPLIALLTRTWYRNHSSEENMCWAR